jgi:hypothetical protein
LLVFSPLGTADFFILLELPGDGYSLLCSKKQPPQHNENINFAWNKIKTQGKFPHCLHGIFSFHR